MGPPPDASMREPSPDLPRDVYFAALREAIQRSYLSEPSNAYRQSGRSSGAARWEQTRRCIADAVHASGAFLDVGCANGLLLQSLLGWLGERGLAIAPHGIDFVPELIALARRRLPRGEFAVANAYYWEPTQHYDFVRTNVEYVPRADRVELVRRQLRAVAPGGRLILCHYRNSGDEPVDVAALLRAAGLAVAGRTRAPNVEVAWAERPRQ
jgi:SAM-dependent methyltransferase